MLKHSLENNQKQVCFEDFRMLRNGYTHNKIKREISEALFIKELRSLLNIQETSVLLLLHNDWPTYNDILFTFFTNLHKCFYLLFVCPYFNGCFPAPNHHCSFIIRLFVLIAMLRCCFWTVKHHHWSFTLNFSLDI